jgi:RNA polymerase sigma factor (sigma-70 family)
MHYNHHDAEDLMYDTLYELQKKWAIITPVDTSRKSWCMSTIYNKSNEIFRKRKKFGGELIQLTDEILNHHMLYEPDMDSEQITEADIARKKDAALSRLNEKERLLYINAYEHKKKQAEIAAEEGVSVDAIAKRSERLRKKLMDIAKELIEKWP